MKLVLPGPEAESAVVAHMRERGYRVEELDPVRNVDIYLDTFDWSLMKNKLSLRYRISNGQAMYTLKSMGDIEEGIAKRMETEVPLDGPVDIPAEVPVKRIRKHDRRPHFSAQSSSNTSRSAPTVAATGVFSPEGAEIELAFDTSSFSLRGLHKPRRRTQKLHELEAEILHGPATALESLASSLSATFGYSPSTASKFEVAIERFKVALPSKKTAGETQGAPRRPPRPRRSENPHLSVPAVSGATSRRAPRHRYGVRAPGAGRHPADAFRAAAIS